MGTPNLRIDCSRLKPPEIDKLAGIVARFLNIQVIGGDTIYASGHISSYDYSNLWKILNKFDVTVD